MFSWISFFNSQKEGQESKLFKSIGTSSDPNVRFRRAMEDEHVIVSLFGGENCSYFAIYDGHGGTKVCEYLRDHLHENILKELKSFGNLEIAPVKEVLEKVYLETDDEIKNQFGQGEISGSTAVSVILVKKNGNRVLYTANCGDARAVLARNKKPIRLTKDHKASDPEEQQRIIQKFEGVIYHNKVAGSLAVTRAFGDLELKSMVKADPYLNEIILTPLDTHLVIACDGLWDVATDDVVVNLLEDGLSGKELSEKLLKYAITEGTRDNVTVMVVKL